MKFLRGQGRNGALVISDALSDVLLYAKKKYSLGVCIHTYIHRLARATFHIIKIDTSGFPIKTGLTFLQFELISL
jgi:hypothetical protein